MKRKQLHILALMVAMLLAACSEEAAVTGQPGDDAMQQLTFDITETSWNGENINVTTRSGETMEGLKGTYPAKSWDFTSVADKEALLSMSDGLTFAPLNGDDDNLTVDGTEKAVKLHGTLIVRNLKAGQEVTIVFKTTDTPRILGFSNLTKPSGFTPPTTEKQTGRGTVGSNGDVIFTTTGAMYIYSINVTEATDEGFGIYCSELEHTNTQVKWSNEEGQWHIGENNYPTYWRQADSGTLDIYAYAPYKASPTYPVTSGVLTFTAQVYGGTTEHKDKLSGSNVDLLYAGETGYARNSGKPVALNFKHALAKLTFGTITNNTGVTLNLTGFTITGNINKSADLNLATGKWSNHVKTGTGYTITTPPPFVTISIPPLADKETIFPPMPNREMLFIPDDDPDDPDDDGKITLNVKINSESASENFNFDVELEQGKNKTLNITVEKNFEVVIE